MNMRTTYRAEYLYPGAFMPEEIYRKISAPTFEAAVEDGPDEDGYFKKDGWYAVIIRERVEKLFRADDGEERWFAISNEEVRSFLVGEAVHWSDLPDDEEHFILRSNIKANSKNGFGVRTRCGNWQIESDFTEVVTP